MADRTEMIRKALIEEEDVVIGMIKDTTPGAEHREDLLKELKAIQEIRLKEEESEIKTVNDTIHRIKEEKLLEVEEKKSKRDFIAKLTATGASFILGLTILSFEKEGFIRSKVLGWIKFKN